MTDAERTHAIAVASGAALAVVGLALLRRRSIASGAARPIFTLGGAPASRDAGGACCAACGEGRACAGGRNASGRSPWRSPRPDRHSRKWEPWVDELDGRNGVYLIRPAGGGDVLYIGESHRGRLKKTLTRHLWNWEGLGSGPTYAPHEVEIAVELADDGGDPVRRQFELIQQLRPRDNEQDGRWLLMQHWRPRKLHTTEASELQSDDVPF